MSAGWSWTRRGRLAVEPGAGDPGWASHVQMPTVLPLSDTLWRVYFAGRDAHNRASLHAADVDPSRDMRVTHVHRAPLLVPGPPGTFEAAGLGPGCALLVDGRVHLYYAGVTLRSDVPQQAIGLAVSDDGIAFERVTAGPVLSTGPRDPYFVTVPFVRRCGAGFEMWYASGTGWHARDGGLESAYTVRRTTSADGVVWSTASALALEPAGDGLTRQTRPWIAGGAAGPELFFSRRDDGAGAYRLHHAPLSADGTRAGAPAQPIRFENPPRPGDWDDAMQAYASVVPLGGGLAMFYNGNGFGGSGFGWAAGVPR